MTEVLVGAGANNIINSIIFSLIDPNSEEEVVLFEPSFP